ncbi:MAG: hypothetical protein M1376_11315 [Planctomycetes bacterium]|nr:hypothetical protein [Planctomycetota bacterium]
MIRLKWLIVVAVCCLAFRPYPASGCEYNVREVGFIDVGIEPYRLLVYLPENTPAGEVSGLKDAMDVALAETNIRLQLVVAGADANQAVMELAKTHGIGHFPAALLVSPDGQSMPLDVSRASSPRSEGGTPSTQTSLAQAIPAALGSILDSPLRRQILEKCADAYGVVLLIEGPEARANATARETIAAAIRQIGEQLEFLPTPAKSKPINTPPALVVLDQKSWAREQVLLWTLHLKAEDVNQPRAAVFYGRGRWLGPLFDAATLTAGNLTQLLSVIGGDCECGLDHRWLQGTMLPARWDETLHEKVVQSLGYDPENPMAKMEMVSIIRRGMGGFDYPGVPLEYREIEVGNPEPQDAGQKTEDRGQRTEDRRQKTEGGEQKALPSSDVRPPSSKVVGQVLAGSLAGMVALVGVVSVVIVLRARKS